MIRYAQPVDEMSRQQHSNHHFEVALKSGLLLIIHSLSLYIHFIHSHNLLHSLGEKKSEYELAEGRFGPVLGGVSVDMDRHVVICFSFHFLQAIQC